MRKTVESEAKKKLEELLPESLHGVTLLLGEYEYRAHRTNQRSVEFDELLYRLEPLTAPPGLGCTLHRKGRTLFSRDQLQELGAQVPL